MSDFMLHSYISHWWSVQLPTNWLVEEGEECVSLYSPTGVGALQISAYRKDDGVVTDKLLLGFVNKEQNLQNAVPESVHCGELTGFTISHVEDGTFWQKWWIGKGRLLLFVTYNCKVENREVELATVSTIFGTFASRVQEAPNV